MSRLKRGWTLGLTTLVLIGCAGWAVAVAPEVSNVSASQRAGTKLVDIKPCPLKGEHQVRDFEI